MAVKCPRRRAAPAYRVCVKEERSASFRKVASILQKPDGDRTDEEKAVLLNCSDLVKEVKQRIEKRQKLKERLKEIEDPPEILAKKCLTLAEALSKASKLVVYTGAGISTAACIPDYRGKNGIWTLLQQGKDIGLHDLTQAEPTLTHMALAQLYRTGLLKYVVSQNCDGLHLRSGLPRQALSEVHGNMYIEVCRQCKPAREYWRLFDVTENTARFSHRTMRHCYSCDGPLVDTIVHFGERGTLKWPLNWPAACSAADKADVILCIGSSLKVLKKYPWLWGMDKPIKKRPKLYIVNLQWTPKDDQAVLKISGRCDDVMHLVMSHLNVSIPLYDRNQDPIFHHATKLHPAEEHTTTQPLLRVPAMLLQTSCSPCHEEEECKLIPGIEEPISKNVSATIKENSLNSDDGNDLKEENSEKEERKILMTPIMEIVYEGVKLKVEGNISVEASVKIDDDLAIFCDRSKIDQHSFMSSYKLECNQHSFHFVSVGNDDMECSNTAISGSDGIKDPIGWDVPHEGESKHENVNMQNEVYGAPVVDVAIEEQHSSDGDLVPGLASSESFNVPAISDHCNSINSFVDNDNYFNSITSVGCEVGMSSSLTDDICVPNTLSLDSTCLTYLPAVLELEHNYGKQGNYQTKDDSCRRAKPGCLLESFNCAKQDSKPRTLRAVHPNRCSTKELSSFAEVIASPKSTKNILTKDKSKQICDEAVATNITMRCSYCKLNYSSTTCLFYSPFKAEFGNYTGIICECCGEGITDSEDDMCNKDASDGQIAEGDSERSSSPVTLKPMTKMSVINPGWYGKGYRKRVKKKR